MASLAEVRVEEAEPMENESQARPEELRLLEALLFASNEPLDTATLAKRMPDGVDVKAALELVREGQLELNQKEAFAPIYFRKGRPKPVVDAAPAPDAPVG